MSFIWNVADLGNWILGLIILVIVYGALFFIFYKVIHRSYPLIFLGVSFVLTFVAFILYLTTVFTIIACFSAAGVSTIIFANLGDFRTFISNPFRRTATKEGKFGVEKIFDRGALYKTIETSVFNFSKSKTGAIMTFEKNISLTDMMKNGVPVHAPVSYELLATIFYPGTRLHDGAVVIHGNEIVAASVFYTPTTKTFAGKYGSRHRAAIGISEVSDAVTVVVSEETGRISFAVNGELITVEPASFLRIFENYMEQVDTSEDTSAD